MNNRTHKKPPPQYAAHSGRGTGQKPSHLAKAPKSSELSGAELFRVAAMRPLSKVALATIPQSERTPISDLLMSAFRASIDGKPVENILMQAVGRLPENPYLVARLAFFYEGHGQSRKAQEYAEKARHLALKAGIRPEALQHS